MAFTDQNEIGSAQIAVNFLLEHNCVGGYVDGSFRPKHPVTRSEFCYMLVRSIISDEACKKLSTENSNVWQDAIRSWAGPYISVFQKVVRAATKNTRYKKIAMNLLRNSFNASICITKKEAWIWCLLFFETLFSFRCYLHGGLLDSRAAERGWVCQLLFDVLKKAAKHFYRYPKVFQEQIEHGIKIIDKIRPRIYFLRLVPEVNYKRCMFIRMLKNNYERDSEHSVWAGKAYQYTNLEALYNMLLSGDKREKVDNNSWGPKIKLRLSNTAYLNDPKEGKLLCDILEEREFQSFRDYFKGNLSDITGVRTSNVYVASLSQDPIERLPMWIQYGDWGRGCRIEFDLSESNGFRQLQYYEESDIPLKLERDFIKKQRSVIIRLALLDILQSYLEKQTYFYKEKYYEHEAELRIVKKAEPQNAKEDLKHVRSGEVFPRLYVESDSYIKISSVILGPKCENQEHIALALKRLGVPVVKRSAISFR